MKTEGFYRRMASLKELYNYLETYDGKQHIDRVFPFSSFSPEEQTKARLEILTWWKVERLVEDENFVIYKAEAISYFEGRIAATHNPLLKYRYSYFAYLLSKNNQFAKQAVDALIDGLSGMLPAEKNDYPRKADDAIEVMMALSERIKYRKKDVEDCVWKVLDSDYGFRVKMVCLQRAKAVAFFAGSSAEKLAAYCKVLFPQTKDGWREGCCEAGLYFASKMKNGGKAYRAYFYEAFGDMEMERLIDPDTEPKNIAIPHTNDSHLEKAMAYYQEAGATDKRNEAERAYRENKKKLIYPRFKVEKKTDASVVKYYNGLKKELIEGKLSWLLMNLSLPVRFLFPSYQMIRENLPEKDSTLEELGFANKIKDINGNTRNANSDFELEQKYDVWVMNLVRNVVQDVIMTAIQTKKLTYGKLKQWFLRHTCFGAPIEYPRANQVVAASWFLQIDYGIEALMKQYQRFEQGKTTDWRIPIDVLSVRFEGILRDMVGIYGGSVTRVGRDNSSSQVLLEGLLKEARQQGVFREEDIDFFEYVFTNKGHNIRNYVAHAFYIPQDYGIVQATLVFLCVLRLSTFRVKESEQFINNF